MSYNSPFTGNVIQPTDVSYRAITLSANTQLSWPINGNATDNYAARIMDVTASTAGLSLAMPPANQASVGQDALIINRGSNTFTVTDYNYDGTIVSVAAGQAKYIWISDNPDEQGTWEVIAFGVGTSSPDASSLAGLGLVANGSTLNQSHPIAAITNGSTFTAANRARTMIWDSGVGTATLPGSSTLGNNWFTLVKNNGTGTLSVSTTGGETIDGQTTFLFQPQESAFIVCTGSGYVTVGYGQSADFQFSVLVKPVTSGTYTLTNSDITNNIHEFTGTLTGNVTVVYPQVVNLYVISNQVTAGGYSLTLTTGVIGSASVTVPANNQVTLVCDGTNFFNANTVSVGVAAISLPNGSASSPSLSFSSETNTGIYRPGTGSFGISVLGGNELTLTAAGMTVNGTGTFVNGISGGTY